MLLTLLLTPLPPLCARCPQALPAACPRRRHLREGKSSKADTEHNVALGCLCAFCSAAPFMNQLIKRIRTALPPRLSFVWAGQIWGTGQEPRWLCRAGGQLRARRAAVRVGDSLEGCWPWVLRV